MRKSILWSFLATLPLLGQVYLVKDGAPKAVIVLESDNVSTRKAGEELQAMLERRTGARLPMQTATDPLPSGTLPVHLGLSERSAQYGVDGTKIPFDGYFFKATPERVVIAGRDAPQTDEAYHGHRQVVCNYKLNYYVFGEKGTCNGVYKILEKFAGNRHYMPGELGDVVPQSPDFALPVTEFVEAPAFRERYFYACFFRDTSEDFLRWFYRLCAGGENHSINHSYGGMIQFKDTHPEYFALIDGKRDFSNLSTANNYGNLCMTNREGIEAFAQRAQKFFARAPGYKVFPVVP